MGKTSNGTSSLGMEYVTYEGDKALFGCELWFMVINESEGNRSVAQLKDGGVNQKFERQVSNGILS